MVDTTTTLVMLGRGVRFLGFRPYPGEHPRLFLNGQDNEPFLMSALACYRVLSVCNRMNGIILLRLRKLFWSKTCCFPFNLALISRAILESASKRFSFCADSLEVLSSKPSSLFLAKG